MMVIKFYSELITVLDKRFFLKLFNSCFNKSMGIQSFKQLLEMGKKSEPPNMLTNDAHVLTVINNRVWKLSPKIQECFLESLSSLLKVPKNVSTIIQVPQALDFIYNFLSGQDQRKTYSLIHPFIYYKVKTQIKNMLPNGAVIFERLLESV